MKKYLKAVELAAVLLATILLLRAGQAAALAQRGYDACGGEYILLLFPALYYTIKKIAADWITEFRPLRKEETMGKNYCDGCCYSRHINNSHALTCDYILMTGHRRPCPPGRGCTAKKVKRRKSQHEQKAIL